MGLSIGARCLLQETRLDMITDELQNTQVTSRFGSDYSVYGGDFLHVMNDGSLCVCNLSVDSIW